MSLRIQEIHHKIVEIYNGKDGEGETDVACEVFEQSAVTKYRHRQDCVIEIIPPTQNRLQNVRLLVMLLVMPTVVDDVDKRIGQHKTEKSHGAERERGDF